MLAQIMKKALHSFDHFPRSGEKSTHSQIDGLVTDIGNGAQDSIIWLLLLLFSNLECLTIEERVVRPFFFSALRNLCGLKRGGKKLPQRLLRVRNLHVSDYKVGYITRAMAMAKFHSWYSTQLTSSGISQDRYVDFYCPVSSGDVDAWFPLNL